MDACCCGSRTLCLWVRGGPLRCGVSLDDFEHVAQCLAHGRVVCRSISASSVLRVACRPRGWRSVRRWGARTGRIGSSDSANHAPRQGRRPPPLSGPRRPQRQPSYSREPLRRRTRGPRRAKCPARKMAPSVSCKRRRPPPPNRFRPPTHLLRALEDPEHLERLVRRESRGGWRRPRACVGHLGRSK